MRGQSRYRVELVNLSGCEALLPSTLIKTRKRIESSKVEVDDRIKVLRGPFRSLLRKVGRICPGQ